VAEYAFTEYFEKAVLKKRLYLRREWCVHVLEHPIRSEPQEHNRYRFWGEIAELEGGTCAWSHSTTSEQSTMRFPIGGSNHES